MRAYLGENIMNIQKQISEHFKLHNAQGVFFGWDKEMIIDFYRQATNGKLSSEGIKKVLGQLDKRFL